MEKEYIENKDGKYFSGQGKVSLEKDGKIYELGNCPKLNIYLNGEFILEWESFGKNTIDLMLGEYVGEENVYFKGLDPELKLQKFLIKKDSGKNYVLHFNGVNTADSNSAVYVKAHITIESNESVNLIEDEILKVTTIGKWNDEIELYREKPKEFVPPSMTLSRKGFALVVTPAYRYLDLGFREFAFDPNKIVSVEQANDNLEECVLVLSSIQYRIPTSLTTFLNKLNSILNDNSNQYKSYEHKEAQTGLRFTDFKK